MNRNVGPWTQLLWGISCWFEVLVLLLRGPRSFLFPLLFRLPIFCVLIWCLSMGIFFCFFGKIPFDSILRVAAGCTLLFAQHILPRLPFSERTWKYCLDSRKPNLSNIVESQPICHSLGWLFCTWLFYTTIAVLGVFAVFVGFISVSVPLVVLLPVILCAGLGSYLWAQYLSPLKDLLQLNSLAMAFFIIFGSVLYRYALGDVVSPRLVLDCALQCGISYQCSCTVSNVLMAKIAIRMNDKARKIFVHRWRFTLFALGFPVFYVFTNHPLLGICTMEVMEGAAAVIVGKIISLEIGEHDRRINSFFYGEDVKNLGNLDKKIR